MVRLILLSGASGAGKSTICHGLEERGFRVLENVPLSALSTVAKALVGGKPKYDDTVLSMPIEEAVEAYNLLKKEPDIAVTFVLLYCSKDELLSRYRLTRHTHPLQSTGLTLAQAIEQDRLAIQQARNLADIYIDSTGTNPVLLQNMALASLLGEEGKKLFVRFTSFGYKYGVPEDAEIVLDCRHVPNPYWDKSLRPLTGLDKPIVDWLESHEEVEAAFQAMTNYLSYFFKQARHDGRHYVAVDLGCTGGQHRSVYFAQRLMDYFSKDYLTFVTHRDITRYLPK